MNETTRAFDTTLPVVMSLEDFEARVAKNFPETSRSNELLTEDHAALEFARLYGDKLKFDHDAGIWREWNGSIWIENRTGKAFHFARELARDLAAREPDKIRYISSKTSFAAGVEKFARVDPAFAVTSERWDSDAFLIGTPNGTVDLRCGTLSKSNPAQFITKSTAVAPTDKPDCPRWLAFLNEATGNDEGMVRFLKQWCGYALTGDTREHALVFLYGPGGNGKSVFVNVISNLLGDYSATPTMESLTVSKGERHSTDIAMLRGARLAAASETEQGRQWAEARIKQLTGGDAVTARFMRQDNFTFRPTFKLMVVGNFRPRLRNPDEAMMRRFNIVPFINKPATPDRQLEAKLKEELPGIFRWAIEGCLDWLRNGLVRPPSIKAETERYFSDQDVFAQWLEEMCDLEPSNRWKITLSGELFTSWTTYARAAGADPGSRIEFSDNLRKRDLQDDKGGKGKRIWRGISMRREAEDDRHD